MTAPRWHAVDDDAALHAEAAVRILAAARAAIAARGRFLVVLAGGDTPRRTYGLLRDARTDWAAWHVYYGDERCLAAGDPARNSAMAAAAWLDHVPIPPAQRHTIPAESGPEEGARRYAAGLAGVGAFDLVLLGLGADGHTASLFPGHAWGEGDDAPAALAVHGAPKPPPERVTLSASRLSRARQALFLVAGEGKRDALARWRAGERIPAAAIAPPGGVDVLVAAAGSGAARR